MIAATSTQRRVRDARCAGARRQTLQHVSRDGSRGVPPPAASRRAQAPPGHRLPEPRSAPLSAPGLIVPTPVDDPLQEIAFRQTLEAWDELEEDALPWEALDDVGELVEGDRAAESSVTLADVMRAFHARYRHRFGHTMTEQQDRVLRELMACYTPLMGTHKWMCRDCGTVVELPNGCNNRHCPCCGDGKRRQWAETTASQLLPVQYYHVMLTVPRQITQLALAYPRVLHGMMLRIGADTLLRCGRLLFDVELALLSLLHSWGSLLNAHLHSHSMLPAGGLRRHALEWIALSRKQIEEVLVLATTEFPERFLTALRKAYDQGQLPYDGNPRRQYLESRAAFDQWLASFNTTQWVIRCPQVWDRREALDDPENTRKTLKYLANYANRVALSNDRILGIDGSDVLLRCKDYRDGGQWKTRRIDGVEFLRRFLQHLIPQGMHHIRRYGWMARRASNEKLTWLREHFHVGEATADENTEGEPRLAGDESSRACRYCPGTLYLTERTYRPRVIEIMWMPWKRFDLARPGPIVTLGPNVPDARAGSARSTPERAKAEAGREASPRPPSACL